MLYPGEELTEAAGYPALVRFEPGRQELPLVVFVTGGGVLGRIAYGPPGGGRAADFLCHWLHEEGFPSLVLSYPIDNRDLFDAAFPQFSVTDWAEQSAEIIARYVDRNGLQANAVVLGWSMAGRIASGAVLPRHSRSALQSRSQAKVRRAHRCGEGEEGRADRDHAENHRDGQRPHTRRPSMDPSTRLTNTDTQELGLRQTRGVCGWPRFCAGFLLTGFGGLALLSVVCQASGRDLRHGAGMQFEEQGPHRFRELCA